MEKKGWEEGQKKTPPPFHPKKMHHSKKRGRTVWPEEEGLVSID